jgi:hypothetical protein
MAYARIDYDRHARDKMRERLVSERQIAAALNRPDRLLAGHSGRLIAERDTAAGNTLRVVFVEQRGGTVAYVITVYRVGRKLP